MTETNKNNIEQYLIEEAKVRHTSDLFQIEEAWVDWDTNEFVLDWVETELLEDIHDEVEDWELDKEEEKIHTIEDELTAMLEDILTNFDPEEWA